MDNDDIVARLRKKISGSNYYEAQDDGTDGYDLYLGCPMGNEIEGKSQIVTREAMEYVEWLMPSLARIFLSGDDIISFEPRGDGDVEAAREEQVITQWHIDNSCSGNGFSELQDWIKSSLYTPITYLKCSYEEGVLPEVGEYTGITEDAIAELMEDEEVEILELDSYPDIIKTEQGDIPVEMYDVQVRRNKKKRTLRYECIRPRAMIIDRAFVGRDLDECDFVAEHISMPLTEWVDMGYDAEVLAEIRTDTEIVYGDSDEDVELLSDDPIDDSMRMLHGYDCYCWMDANDDGVAEYHRFLLVGDVLLESDEVDYQPYIALTAMPQAHKRESCSPIEMVRDIQEVSSLLTRGLLDNVESINRTLKAVSEDSLTADGRTIQALHDPTTEWLPVRGPAQGAFYEQHQRSIIGDILQVLVHINTMKGVRTGVSPETSLDPNVLKDATFGAFMGAMENANQRSEMIARVIADTGFKKLALKTHWLLRSHWDVEAEIRVSGKMVKSTPAEWQMRTEAKVKAGIGHSSRDSKMVLIQQLLEIQKEAAQHGLSGPDKVYNALDDLVRLGRLGETDRYFTSTETEAYQSFVKQQQEQTDPNAELAAAQAEVLRASQDLKNKEAALEEEIAQIKIDREAAELQAKQAVHELEVARFNHMREVDMAKIKATDEMDDAVIDKTNAQVDLIAAQTIAEEAGIAASMRESSKNVIISPDQQ